MPKVSMESATDIKSWGEFGEDRCAQFGGYNVGFSIVHQDGDMADMLAGTPGDSCQCPHWGYVIKGRVIVRYPGAGREEILEEGDAYYMEPGHVPAVDGGSVFLMFSRTDEFEASNTAIMKKLAQQRMEEEGSL